MPVIAISGLDGIIIIETQFTVSARSLRIMH
jgi:hypothetical protein